MAAAKAMVLARLGLALDCVTVRDFAFCHGCEATILTFGISAQRLAIGIQQSAKAITAKDATDAKE